MRELCATAAVLRSLGSIYDVFAILTTPGGETFLSAMSEVCTGSSIVLVFALGRELLCGLGASLVNAGTSASSVAEFNELRWGVGDETLSTRSNRCIRFST